MTILFESEWSLYPAAIVDLKTSNQSFIRYALLLKSMGIKNHAFCLQLHNPDLQGIDPHDPTLTDEIKLAISLECRSNFFYIVREAIKAPSISGNTIGPFKANRGNMAAFWLFFNHIIFFLIQIRQTGKSFSIDTLMAILLNIMCTNTRINLLTKDEPTRASNLVRLKEIIYTLPSYLNQLQLGGVANTEQIFVKCLKNRYEGHIANKSPKAALQLGRGLTSPITHADEFALLYNNGISIPAMLAGGGAARMAAAESGSPYGTIFTTTAGKLDDPDGRYAYELISNSAVWSENFFDCKNQEHLEEVILKSIPNVDGQVKYCMCNLTFSHRQLGYSDEWLRKTIRDSLAKNDAAERDFLNKWTSGSISNPLDQDLLDKIVASIQEDYYVEIDENFSYMIRWFISKNDIDYVMNNDDFILSIDTSEAAGNDDIAMTFSKISTGEVVAAASVNETNLIEYSKWLTYLICKFPRMTVIIERRSTGGMVLDYLLDILPAKGIDPFKRLYNICVQDKEENKKRYEDICVPLARRSRNIYITYKKSFGFTTSGFGSTARSMLYNVVLQNIAKLIGDKIKDKKTIDQITRLISKNNRIDHPNPGRDDHVVSLMLGFWLITKGRNLHHYGIDVGNILINNSAQKQTRQEENSYQAYEQRLIRKEIEELYALITVEKEEMITRKIETRLLQLNSKLILKDGESFSIEQLLADIKKEKKFNKYTSNNNQYGNNRAIANTKLVSHSDVFGSNGY